MVQSLEIQHGIAVLSWNCCFSASFLKFSAIAKGEEVKDFVKNGGCALALHQDLVRQEWRNQRWDRVHYFHKFEFGRKSVATWKILTTSPYLDLFYLKFMHMEQAGIVDKLSRQFSTMKPTEPDVLEPLKLEHFYITVIGIAAGMFLSLLMFAMEMLHSKLKNRI